MKYKNKKLQCKNIKAVEKIQLQKKIEISDVDSVNKIQNKKCVMKSQKVYSVNKNTE